MSKRVRDDTLHLRLDSAFKAEIEAAAARHDIPVAAYARMALREYIARHGPERLRETGTSYGSPPPTPPDKKLRCAIAAAQTSRTSYFVVTRKGQPQSAERAGL